MARSSTFLIGLCCLGLTVCDLTAALAQSKTPPAGSALALTPPVDRRAKQYSGYGRARHVHPAHRRHHAR